MGAGCSEAAALETGADVDSAPVRLVAAQKAKMRRVCFMESTCTLCSEIRLHLKPVATDGRFQRMNGPPTASLRADAVKMLGSAQIEGPVIDSAAGERALTQFVAGQKLIGFARLHHEPDAFLVLEINPTVGEHR